MNAVNLMPPRSGRSERPTVSVSPQALGLFGLLIAILLGSVLYVSAHDTVAARRTQLKRLTAATQKWTIAADRNAPAVAILAQHRRAVSQVSALVITNYEWSRLLSQVAGVLPAHAGLTSLTAGSPFSSAPGAQLQGCAASQDSVAATMVALRKLTDVRNVTLSTSTREGASGKCYEPVQFQIALQFATPKTSAIQTTTAAATATGTAAADDTGVAQ